MGAIKSPSSSDAVLQTVAWARKQNFKTVPLHPASKAAISKRYTELGYVSPDDDFWKRGDYNVGILLGPHAAGPVDIDLDCKEAIFFAPRFLPATPAIFGRESKPASHYIYRIHEPDLDKSALFDPSEKAPVLEIRADGQHQTVFPGSLHQDTKELIRWEGVPFPDVPTVSSEELVKAAKKIGIATLIARHLWNDGQRNEICKFVAGMFYFLDWPVEEAAAVILAVMEYHGDDDRTREITVYSTYRKAGSGSKVVGANSLRKFLGSTDATNALVDRILDWAGSPTINLMQEYNERFSVVSLEGKFRVVDTDVAPGEPPVFYLKDDFLNMMATDYVMIDGKNVSKAKLWLSNTRRRTAWNVDFLPGVDDPPQTVNLWTGWAATPDDRSDCSGWLELLAYICNDETTLRWMKHWFAGILVEPMSKPLTAPVLIGMQGAGKSLMLAYFGKILGPGYTTVTNEEHIYGRFNRHLASTLLLHSEEALYGGEKRHRGIIKSLITDEFRIFEQKGVDARQVRNYLRLVLTSNEPHAAPAEAQDRRFTVIDMGGRKAPAALINKVISELRGTGPAALHHHFRNDFKFDEAVPRINLKNEALRALKQVNFGPIEAWWYETLAVGVSLPDYLAWARRPVENPWPERVSSTALYASAVIRWRETGVRTVPTQAAFSATLDKMIGAPLKRAQVLFKNPQVEFAPPLVRQMSDRHSTILNLPSLEACRDAFANYIGQAVDWPDPIPDGEKPAWEKY